jgi:AcrR family transcriptional regulator
VTSDETRERLLAAAMKVISERGYDGTRVAEVAREAGVTTGAIYNHFDSKADLLTAAIGGHGPGAFTDLVETEPDLSVLEVFRRLGAQLPERSHEISGALMEIIVATRRDEDVAKALTVSVSDSERQRRELIEDGQAAGDVDASLDAAALSRFTTMVAFGSMVADALGLDPVDQQQWAVVIERMLAAVDATDGDHGSQQPATPPDRARTDQTRTDHTPTDQTDHTQGEPG